MNHYDEYGYPCDNCSFRDSCDGWEAQFCCRLCQWEYGDDVDCSDCDSWDI